MVLGVGWGVLGSDTLFVIPAGGLWACPLTLLNFDPVCKMGLEK